MSVLLALVLVFGCAKDITVLDRYQTVEKLYLEKSVPEVPEISVDDLIERQKKETMVIVDEREPAEQEVSMIPGAITNKEFLTNIKEYKDAVVIIYCTIGHRSGLLAQKLRSRKINAYNLKGGILAWAHAGKNFVDRRGNETKRVHVYGPKWNLLPEGYEAVW